MKNKDIILFDPRFGKRPAFLIGRDDVLRDARSSLDDPNESEKITLFSGIKGSGKTAILSEIRAGLDPERVVVVEAGSFVSYEEALEAKNPKVFILDDIEKDIDGIRAFLAELFCSVSKNDGFILKNDGFILFAAGPPHSVQELLKENDVPALRRSYRVALNNVRTDEVLFLYEEAFNPGKKPKTKKAVDVLHRAAEATKGYPYLIQLIGYYLSKEEKEIENEAVDRAVFRAKIELYKNIHEPIIGSLSSKDKMFLWSMAQDDGPSEFGEIAKRMNVSAGYASKYRERLLGADVIYSSSYGELSFTLPYMKEYVDKEYIERFGGEGGKRRL